MAEVKEQIGIVLDELRRTGDIEASAVVRRDGLMIASDLSSRTEPRTIAAMTAALVGTAETTSNELKRGAFLEVVVDSEKGKIVAIGAGRLALLVSLMRPEGNLGFVLLSMERAAKSIDRILSEEGPTLPQPEQTQSRPSEPPTQSSPPTQPPLQ